MKFNYSIAPDSTIPRSYITWAFADNETPLRIKWLTDNGHKNAYPETMNIVVNKEKDFPAICSHELSHSLTLILFPKMGSDFLSQQEKFRDEMITWRIAKTICKPELWDEEFALLSLKTYAYYWKRFDDGSFEFLEPKMNINWDKVKIIPWDNKRLNQ